MVFYMINILLQNYKELTLKLIDEVSNIENIESIIKERDEVINNIKELDYNKEELAVLFDKLDIISNDQKLINKVRSESVKIKNALDNIQKLKKARETYDRSEGTPLFFNMVSY